MKRSPQHTWIKILSALIVTGLITWAANLFSYRIDFTENDRFTLSEAAVQTAENLDQPVIIDVFLDGDLPSEFRRLRSETRQILKEYAAANDHVKHNFIDPLEEDENQNNTVEALQQLGLTPASVTIEDGNRVSQELVFPWAIANQGNRTVRIPLLKNKLGASTEERVNSSVQQLEYVFADAFKKLSVENKKKIAVLKGNGEMDDILMADFLRNLQEYYQIAPFTLDSVANNPEGTLEQLRRFDMALIAKPTERFSEEEKFVLDQYTMNGGKSLWLIDQVNMELDSLFSNQGRSLALARDLNLNDMFFRYGLRINPELIADLYFTQIVLATGEGRNAQYNPAPWIYAPMVLSKNNHPINNNTEGVRLRFANPIDTLDNGIQKTVLLQSSPLSKTIGTPTEIELDIVNRQPDRETFNEGNQPLAVLLEGSLTSTYQNRVLPFELKDFKKEGIDTRLIVVADGDIIRNDLQNGQPLELGYDKWTNNFYGNKEFLMNSVNYLLDDNGLINIRSKEVELAFLDRQRAVAERSRWQLVNIGLPIAVILLFGWIFSLLKKRKYTA
ncbi:gliding motility-associated ABC transporter substrate-binding protein GldG [Robertkochia aurantiaca]|uniref:gliding motility-associated ABC transporter substrate-binding protein GldG n=1 Tax=Robertkochia aurantiaca TaxID=2873700 RepID=UPI001CCA5674|nr:gliding motility-associated ABC transporter substrate-binding protein GldG [Robertkochia sp. 3YJGBD-33]